MIIEKIQQSVGLLANVFGIKTNSDKDTYSCNYINDALEGTIVYENETGNSGDVTLTRSIENARYIDIEYSAYGYFSTKRIYSPARENNISGRHGI